MEQEKMERKIRDKAELAYATGSACVDESIADRVLEELKKYNGVFYGDIRMNGSVIIEKA